MNRAHQTLLICAALALPAVATAGEEREDPRAQVTTGFGPRVEPARPNPTLLPAQEQPESAWMVSTAGAGFGFLAGGIAGVAISSSYIDCHSGLHGLPGFECLTGSMQSWAIGLGAGVGGAVLGGWAAGALYRATRTPVRVTPVVGKGAQGLAISGTF
jgi:hypothetical protein